MRALSYDAVVQLARAAVRDAARGAPRPRNVPLRPCPLRAAAARDACQPAPCGAATRHTRLLVTMMATSNGHGGTDHLGARGQNLV